MLLYQLILESCISMYTTPYKINKVTESFMNYAIHSFPCKQQHNKQYLAWPRYRHTKIVKSPRTIVMYCILAC